MVFALHPRLAADTIPIGDLPLCRVLLMNHRHFPWLILVPRREGMREMFDLGPKDYHAVMEEVRLAAEKFAAMTGAHKMNIAALGNQVEQLHIHIIARFKNDAAWPNPIWNSGMAPAAYSSGDAANMTQECAVALDLTTITKM